MKGEGKCRLNLLSLNFSCIWPFLIVKFLYLNWSRILYLWLRNETSHHGWGKSLFLSHSLFLSISHSFFPPTQWPISWRPFILIQPQSLFRWDSIRYLVRCYVPTLDFIFWSFTILKKVLWHHGSHFFFVVKTTVDYYLKQ